MHSIKRRRSLNVLQMTTLSYFRPLMARIIVTRMIYKKVNGKVQEEPQEEVAANP